MTPDRLIRDQEAIESLLRDFFGREMPSNLPSAPEETHQSNVPRRATIATSTVQGRSSQSRIVLAGTVAACVAVIAFVTFDEPASPHRSSRAETSPSVADHRFVRSPSVASSAADMRDQELREPSHEPLFVIESFEPLDAHRLAAPVEEHTRLRWTNVGLVDEKTGARISVLVPIEDQVEIMPLSGTAPARLTPRAPPDARLPEERARSPRP